MVTAPTTEPLSTEARVPIKLLLGSRFPDARLTESLIEDYFRTVHWFSLVICEPKLRRCLASIEDGYAYKYQTPFLVLLSMMLCMAAWYRSKPCQQNNGTYWALWSSDLLGIVESRLAELMDGHSIETAQTCILLGSHHVYHGQPNKSFALLGATIKICQSLGIHKRTTEGDSLDIEEHKRVWWTVYTWDR